MLRSKYKAIFAYKWTGGSFEWKKTFENSAEMCNKKTAIFYSPFFKLEISGETAMEKFV